MNEKQKQLLETFPKRDRGLFGEDVSDEENKDAVPDLVGIEDDPLQAAQAKAKIKQKAMRERKLEREGDDDDEDAK